MSYAHFVDLLFSFQRPINPATFEILSPAAGVVFLLRCLQTVKKNFEEFFSRFSVSPSEFSAAIPSARALYLTTPRPPVNRKILHPVDFFSGCFGRETAAQKRVLM